MGNYKIEWCPKNTSTTVLVPVAMVILLLLAGIISTPRVSWALEYYTDRPLMFTYRTKHNYWFGCGPVQCVWSGSKTEKKVKSYIRGYRRKGEYSYIGRWGRCRVYQAKHQKIRAGDHKPRRIVRWMKKKC